MSPPHLGTMGAVNDARPGHRTSVVLVDDSTEVRALVRRRLELSGLFEVVGEGGDGTEAISLVHRLEPQLLLLDTSMPTMDGIEALPAILALCPETRVVMFTGFEEIGLAARARELGAADFVEKSIQLEELPGRLLRALNKAPPDLRAGARHGLSLVGDGVPPVSTMRPLRSRKCSTCTPSSSGRCSTRQRSGWPP